MTRSIVIILLLFFPLSAAVMAQDLTISVEDLEIGINENGGFDLWIRRKYDIASVIITESTEHSTREPSVFALRNPYYNSINGDEFRLLNGEFIQPNSQSQPGYPLIDSTDEPHPGFGRAFHIHIPDRVIYGYQWTRNGILDIGDGVYINLRAFDQPYADYNGRYMDNPFQFSFNRPAPDEPVYANRPDERFNRDTVNSYREITPEKNLRYSLDRQQTIGYLDDIFKQIINKNLDLVFVLDTTRSMYDNLDSMKKNLYNMLNRYRPEFDRMRVGFVLFKDYNQAYLTRVYPLSDNPAGGNQVINDLRASGGGDVSEAIHEALTTAINDSQWENDSEKMIVLISDAPPHSPPRGDVDADTVRNLAYNRGITIKMIILAEEN